MNFLTIRMLKLHVLDEVGQYHDQWCGSCDSNIPWPVHNTRGNASNMITDEHYFSKKYAHNDIGS